MIDAGIVHGVVTQFDEHVGLGEVTLDSGEVVPFHCVNIADGTRTIEVNTEVSAEAYVHPLGRLEVRDIKKSASQ